MDVYQSNNIVTIYNNRIITLKGTNCNKNNKIFLANELNEIYGCIVLQINGNQQHTFRPYVCVKR